MADMAGKSGGISPPPLYVQQHDERTRMGIRRLFRAMLEDAVSVYRAGASGNKQQLAEVDQWLREESEDRGPFSFVSICKVLGIEPRAARKACTAWKTDGSGERAMRRIARRPAVMATCQLRANPQAIGCETFVRDALTER